MTVRERHAGPVAAPRSDSERTVAQAARLDDLRGGRLAAAPDDPSCRVIAVAQDLAARRKVYDRVETQDVRNAEELLGERLVVAR